MKNMNITAQKQRISEFASLCQQGIDAWVKAGEILVELVEEDPSVFDKIIQFDPRLNHGILGRFEQMGRRVLHPQLLMSDSPGYDRLSMMPLSVQERLIKEPVPLVVETDNGTDILLVSTRDMTTAQAKQVFAKDRVRTEGEQKAWLVDQRAKKAKPCGDNVPCWSIKGGRAVFNAGAALTAGELATILTQLTR